MKKMKRTKIMAAFLTILLLVASISTVVSADPTNSGASIIIENDPSSTGFSIVNESFDLYRVFDVESSTEAAAITYSVNEDFEAFFEGKLGTGYSEQDAIDYVEDFDELQNLVTELRTYVLTEGNTFDNSKTTISGTTVSNGVEIMNSGALTDGYYLIIDSEATASSTGIIPAASLITLPRLQDSTGVYSGSQTITLKGSMPSIDKKVWHDDATVSINNLDSPLYGDNGEWDIVADYAVGDTVEYLITATLPTDATGYDSYTYLIYDTLSEGIEFDASSLAIFIDDSLTENMISTGGYHDYSTTTQPAGYVGEETVDFWITFDVLGILNDPAFNADTVYIYYTGVVTDAAEVALDYESNTASLIYSNNPYDSSSTGQLDSTVYSYTFNLDVTKVQGDGTTPLAGAKFALYEATYVDGVSTNTQIYLKSMGQDTIDGVEVDVYVVDTDNATANDTEAGGYTGCITTTTYTDDDENVLGGRFVIYGLNDAKSYVLTEVAAPDGFNEADSMSFAIKAVYSLDSNGVSVPTLTTSGSSDISATTSGAATTVVNTSATLLPTTGGMGTTILMASGGTIMLLAAVLLLVKRRRDSYDMEF